MGPPISIQILIKYACREVKFRLFEKMRLRKNFNRKSAIIFVMLPRELGCAQNPDGSLKDASEIQ